MSNTLTPARRLLSTTAVMRDVDGKHFGWRETTSASDRPVVVLLHGLSGSRLSWEPQLVGLGARYRVAASDLPGYGVSAPLAERVTFSGLANAVARFADEIGATRVHLVGISFGGMIAQYAAAAYPERVASLALLSTSPKFGLDGTTPEAWRAARLAPLDAGQEPIDFADVVLRSIGGPSITPDALAGQKAAMARVSGAALRTSIDCLVAHDSRPILRDIVAPTRVVVGELDNETPVAYSRYLADHILGARLSIIAGAGHLVNVECPAAVNAVLADHVDRSVGAAV